MLALFIPALEILFRFVVAEHRDDSPFGVGGPYCLALDD